MEFARRNQPSWVVHSQEGIIRSNLKHFERAEAGSPSKADQEPRNISQDTLMNTGVTQGLVPTVYASKEGSIKDISLKSARKSKHSNYTIVSVASKQQKGP